MSKNEILEELKEVISAYIPEKSMLNNLKNEDDLINDLKINSAHIVDIVLDIEDKYDIMIEDDAIIKMNTIGESINVICDKLELKVA